MGVSIEEANNGFARENGLRSHDGKVSV